jgi:hypothetical protein
VKTEDYEHYGMQEDGEQKGTKEYNEKEKRRRW